MTVLTKHAHGMFSWTDLTTTNVDAAKKFYGGLFGWKFDDMPAGEGAVYSMCTIDGHSACAVTSQRAEDKKMGIPPHWTCYFTVNDVDAAAKKVEPAGGKVILPAFDVMDVGRMAMIQDGAGAIAALWQAKKHIGAEITGEHGTITWAELLSASYDAAGKFWMSVLGWKAEPQTAMPGMQYTVFKAGDVPSCGMMPMPDKMKGIPSHWTAYFQVTDLLNLEVGLLFSIRPPPISNCLAVNRKTA
jgi:predicted enzyme related to lactoylglutathione lyase